MLSKQDIVNLPKGVPKLQTFNVCDQKMENSIIEMPGFTPRKQRLKEFQGCNVAHFIT